MATIDFKWAQSLTVEEWAKILSSGKGPNNEPLPPLPSNEIQSMFVGSYGYDAFLEANIFIEKMKDIISKYGKELSNEIEILDCGVGWGRLYRSLLRYVDTKSILGVDIDPKIIQICVDSMPYGHFNIIDKNPPYAILKDDSFDLIYLYSVFSHLSEAGFISMINEFSRIIKKNGFLVFTTLKPAHLNVWNSRLESEGYGPILKKNNFNLEQWSQDMNDGKFIFVPFGGGDSSRPSDYYGETIITEEYLKTIERFYGFKVITFDISDVMPQTFVVMQKI